MWKRTFRRILGELLETLLELCLSTKLTQQENKRSFRKILLFHRISCRGSFVERQLPQSFGQFARNFAQTVLFHKISTPGFYLRLRYFLQFMEFKAPFKQEGNKRNVVSSLNRINFDNFAKPFNK